MDPIAWAFYAVIAVGLLTGALLHYRRNEPAGRGRYALAALRAGSLALLVLLLFDPVLPARGAAGRAPTVALVDASLSMRLASPDGTSRWQEAVGRVRDLAPARIVLFGAGPARAARSLDGIEPDRPESLLGPALRSALEGGAGRLVVVTDGALGDPGEVARLASGAGIPVAVELVGERTAWNAGLVELGGAAWVRADEEVEVRVGVARIGEGAPDSAGVRLWWDAVELTRTTVGMPPEGRVAATSLRFTPRSGMSGFVRLDAELTDGGAEPADDRRSIYVRVEEQPAGVVLVSFLPDQEPRFLLPVLERALGVPARGWLAVGPDRFVRLGVGRDAGVGGAQEEVRQALAGADLVVLHGMDGTEPAWARDAARRRPALLFPRGILDGVAARPGPPRPGDWYADAELPGSPVTPFLAGARVQDAPPLSAIRTVQVPAGWWVPLYARQDRRGEAHPVLVAGEEHGRRVAVALGDGFWRWAFAEEGGRAVYESLWAGVAGWLAEEEPGRTTAGIRPEDRVIPRGEPVRWLVPPVAESLRVTLQPLAPPRPVDGVEPDAAAGAAAEAPLDTVVAASQGVAIQAPPRAGHYRYEVRALVGVDGAEPVTGSGELTIERFSPEFTRPTMAPRWATDPEAVSGAARASGASPGRALRTKAWPYMALVVLLCTEWVLRRRWGLR